MRKNQIIVVTEELDIKHLNNKGKIFMMSKKLK